MATSTFERKIELKDIESLAKLVKIMEAEPSITPLSKHPYTEKERERSAELLKQCLYRSRH